MTDSEDRSIRLTRGGSGMDTAHAASVFQRKVQWIRDMVALYIDAPFSQPMICRMWLSTTAMLLVSQLLWPVDLSEMEITMEHRQLCIDLRPCEKVRLQISRLCPWPDLPWPQRRGTERAGSSGRLLVV